MTTARLPHSDSTRPGSSDRQPHSESAGLDCPLSPSRPAPGSSDCPTPTSRDLWRPAGPARPSARRADSASHRDRNPGIDSAAPLRVDRARLRLLRDSAHYGRATPRRPAAHSESGVGRPGSPSTPTVVCHWQWAHGPHPPEEPQRSPHVVLRAALALQSCSMNPTKEFQLKILVY